MEGETVMVGALDCGTMVALAGEARPSPKADRTMGANQRANGPCWGTSLSFGLAQHRQQPHVGILGRQRGSPRRSRVSASGEVASVIRQVPGSALMGRPVSGHPTH